MKKALARPLTGLFLAACLASTCQIAAMPVAHAEKLTLEALAGVEYESCCYAIRLLGRHYVRNVEGERDNALYLEIELKGLGNLGRHSEDLLRRAIVGYTRYGE